MKFHHMKLIYGKAEFRTLQMVVHINVDLYPFSDLHVKIEVGSCHKLDGLTDFLLTEPRKWMDEKGLWENEKNNVIFSVLLFAEEK